MNVDFFALGYPVCIIYYLLFIIYYLLFIIYYLLFIIYYLLFIIYWWSGLCGRISSQICNTIMEAFV